jgi:outer membrane lipoprotein-sorting protein
LINALSFGDERDMKRLLLILMLIALAISGCTEKGPGVAEKSQEDLKNLSVSSAENLTSFALESSASQVWQLDAGPNATAEEKATITESTEMRSTVNLTGMQVHATASSQSEMKTESQPEVSNSTKTEVFLLGNSTYVWEEGKNWTHLVDPRSAEEVWSGSNNNHVLSMARSFSLSNTEDLGGEDVNGEDAYKLRIVSGDEEDINLYNTAISVAAKIVGYPLYIPTFNRTELNETAKTEKTIWISKSTYLPVKYQSTMSFTITPEIVGAMDLKSGQMTMLNQSIRLGEVSVLVETSDIFRDFDTPKSIVLPEEALNAPAISPLSSQAFIGDQA